MKVITQQDRPLEVYNDQAAQGVSRTNLISDKDGAPNFTMRLFQVEPEGFSPYHSHDYEHVVYVVHGNGELRYVSGTTKFQAGDSIVVSPNEEHQFRNTGNEPLLFTCTIPHQESC